VFSAKGAAFIGSTPQDGFAVANLGQRPGINRSLKPSALKAQFKLCWDAGAELTRAFSARLVGQSDSWGDAPG
jgi:hypothetical protein